jgi:hypothetical protein
MFSQMRVDTPSFCRDVPFRLAPGVRLGSCELLLAIARGGMAQVWAACQHGARGFHRLVALKTVLPELAEPEFEALFLDEARLAARIHHPNVCEVFELVEDGGMLGLAMEWVDGDTLHAVLNAAYERLDLRIAAQIVAHIASGLHAAHELRDENGAPLGLVHRDVSPHNVLISRDGRVKVGDFGVAKALGGTREQTVSGHVRGKLNYLSPEQARGERLDRRSDVFALGIVLYVASVGAHPFARSGQAKDRQLTNLLTGRLARPSAMLPQYPKALEAIVMKALQQDPNARFATADEMRRELLGWVIQTGGLVGDHDVAHALHERLGPVIERRAAQIAGCLRTSRERRAARASTSLPPTPGAGERAATASLKPPGLVSPVQPLEPTFVLTSAAARFRPGQSLSQVLRLALPLVGAAAFGGLGAIALTRPPPVPRAMATARLSPDAVPANTSARNANARTSLAEPAVDAAGASLVAAPAGLAAPMTLGSIEAENTERHGTATTIDETPPPDALTQPLVVRASRQSAKAPPARPPWVGPESSSAVRSARPVAPETNDGGRAPRKLGPREDEL